MQTNSNRETHHLLDLIDEPIAIATPIYDGDNLADLRLDWLNQKLSTVSGANQFVGMEMTRVFPELANENWLTDLLAIRGTLKSVRTFRRPLANSTNQTEVYWLDFRWLGNEVIVQVELLASELKSRAEAMRAVAIVSKLITRVPILYSIRTGDEWIRFSTQKFTDTLNWENNNIQMFDIDHYTHKEDLGLVRTWLATPIKQRVMPLVVRLVTTSDEVRWCELWMTNIGDDQSHVDGDLLLIRDIDSQVTLQKENAELTKLLKAELDSVKAALNASAEGFAIWRAVRKSDGEISTYVLEFMNTTGAAPTGKRPDELEGRFIEDVLGPDQYDELMQLFTAAITTGEAQRAVVDFESSSGWSGAYEDYIVPFMSERVLASFRDISAEKMEQKRLKWLADHDHLTGIPNRAHLDNYLSEALAECRLENLLLGFVFIDIDDFKTVNDTLGHDAGDRLLINFVKRLQNAVPPSAMISRIAGDEFAIVFHDIADIAQASEYLRAIFASMRRDFNHDHPPIQITVSAGCAVTDGKISVSELMRVADRAMYSAKHDGKDRFKVVSHMAEKTSEYPDY